jgi:hypothetical protein|tara:strand:+ start:386 stop:529 length:144 start_codon:yes stop_codon:yes gene_type:complete
MTKKKMVNKKGDIWEYEETPETRAALKKLHDGIRKLEEQAPDYGVGK